MPISPQCSRIAMSDHKESAYGTVLVDGDMDQLYQPIEPALLNTTQERIDDAEHIKGHEFPLDTSLDVIVAQDVQIPFTFPGSTTLIAQLLSNFFGSISTSGAGDPFTHTFKVLDRCVTDQIPSTSWTLGLQGTTASYKTVKGVVLNELRIASDGPGPLVVSGTAFTDGTLTDNADLTFPTTNAAVGILNGNTMDFLTANSGSGLVSKKAKFRGFEFIMNNNLDLADGRSNVATAGKFLSSLRFGNREFSLVVRVEGHQGDEFYDDYEAETVKDVQIKVTKTTVNRELIIRIKNCRIANAAQSFDGLRDILALTYKPFYTAADSTPVECTVYNNKAAYLLTAT